MKKNFLQRHRFIGSMVLSFVYLAPLAALPLQPGMQLVADPQLQACLDQAVNTNNWTTTEEVTELNCPDQGIQYLGGIEQLINLNQLNLSGNRLNNTFGLEQLNQLTVLDLSENRLTDIAALLNLHNLQQLNLSGNAHVNTWDVEAVIQNNVGLTHLGVADIPLQSPTHFWLPPSGPQGEYNLVELDISRTGQYFDLNPLMQYPNLKVLKAAGIHLHYTGPLDSLQQLEVLDLSNNKMTELSGLLMLNRLQQLNLNGNSQVQAPDVLTLIQHNPGLTHLGLADIAMGNDLNWLPPQGPQGEYNLVELDISRTGQYPDIYSLTQHPQLKVIKAAGNQILHTGPFDQLPQLETLDLSDNRLSILYGLQALHNLRQLNLNGNSRLQAPEVLMLIQNNPGLTHLGLADIAMGNDLNWLPPQGPQGEYNLVELDISRTGQYLDLFHLTQYPHLKVIKAAGNQTLHTGPFDQLPQLETLDLGDNRLSILYGLQAVHSLRQLNLNGNSRLQAPEVLMLIQNNPGLTHLGVADIAMGNDLNWLPPQGPQGEYNLVELDISRTGQYLDLFHLTQYPHLKVLKAAGNQTLHTGPLDQFQYLEALDLGDNSLTDLYGLQALHNLRQLNLSGNSQVQAPEVLTLIQNNPGLTHLGLADIAMGNDLNWLPPHGPQGEYDLVELDISRTGQYLDLFNLTQYPHLKVLKAAGNQTLHTGPFDQFQYLEALDLSNNSLTDLYGLQALHDLRQLNLSGNSSLSAADVQSVIYNNLGLTRLGVADIAMGGDLLWLPQMGYNGEYNLVELDISRTGQYVDLNPINQWGNLRILKASGLQLQYADPISQLQKLEILDLTDNALKHAEMLGSIGSLIQLDLRGNPLIPCQELDSLEAALAGVEFYRPESCVYLTPPMITLLTPVEAEQYFTTGQIHLSASANDVEDGDISQSIKWTSSLGGEIGTGNSLNVSLSAGQHQLTATITDSHGNTDSKSVNVTVVMNNPPELTLSSIQYGMVFNAGNPVLLTAQAIDAEEGNISQLIQWSSSIDGNLGAGGEIQSPLTAGQHTITASVTDTAGVTTTKTALITVNALPELVLQAPASGTVYQQGDAVTLTANANDPEDGNLSTQIVWTSSQDGSLGNGAQLNLNLTAGTHLITASVTDSAGASVTQSVTVTVNSAPQISLQTPASGSVFMLQEAIELNATAVDPESGNISADIQWSSDIDGSLGTGGTLVKTLSLGTHTLTATIGDNEGGVASVSTQVVVQQIDLNVTVSGNGKRKTAELVWSGARTSVDIYMNNSVVAVAPASGSQQVTFKNSATFKVCETNTNLCSIDVFAQ